jgi:hypothetical protein
MSPVVKALIATALVVLILISVGAGSIHAYKKSEDLRHAMEIAQMQKKVAEVTKTADLRQQKADELASERAAAELRAQAAAKTAEQAKKDLQTALDTMLPQDVGQQVVVLKDQRDKAVVALHAEEAAHLETKNQLRLATEENQELRLEVKDLKLGLENQIKLTSDLNERLEKADKGRIRWRNITFGVSLVGGGAALGGWLARR